MSALDVVLIFFLIIGAMGLLVLVVRKIPILRVTDPSQLKKLGQQAVKQRLSELRVKRKLGQLAHATRFATAALWHQLRSAPQIPEEEISEDESSLENKLAQEITTRTSPKKTATELMVEADTALERENLKEAEAAYLQAIELDPHNLEAYQGLGEVYLESRDYEAAREVFEYLAHRGSEVVSTLGLARVASGQGHLEEARGAYLKSLGVTTAVQPRLELVKILRELGNLPEALKHLTEARKIEPNNPKILDLFVELSILSGRPEDAQEALDQLREVNPDNQKIASLAVEIRQLRDKLRPKSRRRPKRSRGETFGLPR